MLLIRRRLIPNFFAQIIRINPKTGLVERPWRERDGNFVLSDPKHGAERHLKENATLVDSYSEALDLVRQGYLIRMSDGRGSASLVAPGSIEVIDEPVEQIDDLWQYTMPEVPFLLEDVLSELRQHLLSQASDLCRIANESVASEFIGLQFDAIDDAESKEFADKIDINRFNITRIARAAFVATFRPWSGPSLSDDDADELEQILGASLNRFGRRHCSPLEREESALFRTLMGAYYRWQIADGCFLGEGTLDQNAMTALMSMTGMPASAIRNALSKEGISTVKGKIDYPALMGWLKNRRSFAPLREDEQPNARLTWDYIHLFKTKPMQEAFEGIRRTNRLLGPGLDSAEQALLARNDPGGSPTDAELRAYARAAGALPDSFIIGMREAR